MENLKEEKLLKIAVSKKSLHTTCGDH